MSNFIRITPFMTVDNLNRAVRFFTDVLGFTTYFNAGGYAYLQRETAGFRILEENSQNAAPLGNRRYAYYIDVNDVDQLYAELRPKLDILPIDDVEGPIDREYGQRELLVLAPDGNYLVFGHSIAERST
jgi:catechol 2,3-dioxygenase-like lactoylglutathione lyase family enzyme